LAGLLWPEQREQAARANLHRVLANLRQILGDRETDRPLLSITPQTVQRDGTPDLWNDVAAFLALQPLFLRSRSALARDAIEQMEQAVALYRGDLLEEFSLSGSAAFEEVAVSADRQRFERAFLDTLNGQLGQNDARWLAGPAWAQGWQEIKMLLEMWLLFHQRPIRRKLDQPRIPAIALHHIQAQRSCRHVGLKSIRLCGILQPERPQHCALVGCESERENLRTVAHRARPNFYCGQLRRASQLDLYKGAVSVAGRRPGCAALSVDRTVSTPNFIVGRTAKVAADSDHPRAGL
jgi:hypothetical protein